MSRLRSRVASVTKTTTLWRPSHGQSRIPSANTRRSRSAHSSRRLGAGLSPPASEGTETTGTTGAGPRAPPVTWDSPARVEVAQSSAPLRASSLRSSPAATLDLACGPCREPVRGGARVPVIRWNWYPSGPLVNRAGPSHPPLVRSSASVVSSATAAGSAVDHPSTRVEVAAATPASVAYRSNDYSGARWRDRDLPALGWRHRGHYDMRATFITLAIEDGADPDVIETRVTHSRKARKRVRRLQPRVALGADVRRDLEAPDHAWTAKHGDRATAPGRRRVGAAALRCSPPQALETRRKIWLPSGCSTERSPRGNRLRIATEHRPRCSVCTASGDGSSTILDGDTCKCISQRRRRPVAAPLT
jgi:hypothetical protein